MTTPDISTRAKIESIVSTPVRFRIVGSIFVAQSLFSTATLLSFALTPVIAVEMTGNDSMAGLPTTLTLISRALLAYPFGWLLDRIGRRLGLSLGYLVGVVGTLVAAWSVINGSFAGFLTGAALIGGVRASAEQGRYIAAEIFSAGRQAKVIGWIVFAGTIGSISVIFLSGPVTDAAEALGLIKYAGPFIVSGLLLLIAGALIFIFLRPDPRRLGQRVAAAEAEAEAQASGKTEMAPIAEARPLRQIFNNSTTLLAVGAMTIGQFVMAMLMVITPVHMNHNGHDTESIFLVIVAHTMGMFGFSGGTGWLIGRFGRLSVITAGGLILVVAALLTPISTEVPMLALSLFLLGLGWNFAFVAGSSLLSYQLESHERGRAQGAGEMLVATGAGIGSLSSGILFAAGGIVIVSAIGLAFALALLALVTWVRLYPPPEPVLSQSGT